MKTQCLWWKLCVYVEKSMLMLKNLILCPCQKIHVYAEKSMSMLKNLCLCWKISVTAEKSVSMALHSPLLFILALHCFTWTNIEEVWSTYWQQDVQTRYRMRCALPFSFLVTWSRCNTNQNTGLLSKMASRCFISSPMVQLNCNAPASRWRSAYVTINNLFLLLHW